MGCGGAKQQVIQAGDQSSALDDDAKKTNDEDIRDKYELGAILGSGSFGQVREATVKSHPNSEVRAVKMIERDNEDGEWSNQAIFVREVGLLQTIQHENIIRYYDFYEDLHFLYVVMELCRGGEVFAKIVELKRFSEKDAARIGLQMLNAIQYIHSMHIIHRDIKAENFMLAENSITSQVKMIDFGMACKFYDGQVLTELCGSPHYLAPELIGQKYNSKADVWAFGVLLYLIMYGHYPYDAKHPRDIMVKILTEPIRWPSKVTLSATAMDFLRKLLVHDPKKRLSPEEALAHEWMAQLTRAKPAEPAAEEEEDEAEAAVIDQEILRSAHKKVTDSRKQVDPSVDEARNKKLKEMDEDFAKGVRHGHRLGPTPKEEEYMSRPEFIRRENKITTAPSRGKRNSAEMKLFKGAPIPGSINEDEQVDAAEARKVLKRGRSRSFANGEGSAPRRLSYLGNITSNDENQLASLYDENRPARTSMDDTFLGVVPGKESKTKTSDQQDPDSLVSKAAMAAAASGKKSAAAAAAKAKAEEDNDEGGAGLE